MDHILLCSLSFNDQRLLNSVRQYLQVTSFAELVDNDGRTLHAGAFGQTTSDNITFLRKLRTPKTNWPLIDKPPKRAFRLWKAFIETTWSLHTPLGNWIYPACHRLLSWTYSFSHSTPPTIYHHNNQRTYLIPFTATRTKYSCHHNQSVRATAPTKTTP